MRGNKERALRLIAGALFGSDLTPKDLMEISECLFSDRKWTERLSYVVRELARTLDVSRSNPYPEILHPEQTSEESVGELVRMFSQKRLSKAKALSLLEELSDSNSWKPDARRTLRENARALVLSLSGAEETSALIARIADFLQYGGDPYLRRLS